MRSAWTSPSVCCVPDDRTLVSPAELLGPFNDENTPAKDQALRSVFLLSWISDSGIFGRGCGGNGEPDRYLKARIDLSQIV